MLSGTDTHGSEQMSEQTNTEDNKSGCKDSMDNKDNKDNMDKMDNKDNMDQNRCQNKQTRRIISLDVGIAWITRIIRITRTAMIM